jgi:hypothetical protein
VVGVAAHIHPSGAVYGRCPCASDPPHVSQFSWNFVKPVCTIIVISSSSLLLLELRNYTTKQLLYPEINEQARREE